MTTQIPPLLKLLGNRSQLNYRPIAVCPIRINKTTGELEAEPDYDLMLSEVRKNWDEKLPIMRYDDNLVSRIATMGGQTVMITDILERFSDNLNTFALRMETMNLEIALTTSAADIAGHVTTLRNLQGLSVMTITLPQYSPAAMVKKRVFDIIVSTIAIICSSPFMLVIALAIKIEDGGPIFYKQERIGKNGKPFYIHKFRSMRVNADAYLEQLLKEQGQEMGARYKLKTDPRITRVGNFIRKTSLDELPQFFDSFIGTMSVVGPRPQRQFEVDEYDQVYATRLLVKPGITGPWQTSGRSDLNEEESRQLDVAYVQYWSILGDINYILRTVGVMLNPRGAY
ncbi:sugar transferase [Bifidobacterium choloepi]|uniref:sugar transferase n=1 Tax=Bifidobacterium choloepi TaxID=2614131 RepID=UPI001E5F3C46|nr:sugar transferase [Bifidobacterium choloepi]